VTCYACDTNAAADPPPRIARAVGGRVASSPLLSGDHP